MSLEQKNDSLTIQAKSGTETKWLGLILFLLAFGCFWYLETYTSSPLAFSLPAALIIGTCGLLLATVLPTIYTLDHKTGDLVILHRTRMFQWEDHYPLSSIRSVILMTWFYEDSPNAQGSSVVLVIRFSPDGGYLVERRINWPCRALDLSSVQSEADRLASFLDLTVDDETKVVPRPEAYYP